MTEGPGSERAGPGDAPEEVGHPGGPVHRSPDDPHADGLDVHHPPRRAPSRRALTAIVVPLVVLVIAAQAGDALAPSLLPDENGEGGNPLLLIALNPRNRWLIGVVNHVDLVWYYLIGTVRALLSDPLFYLLGYWYGDSAVRWMERRTPTFGGLMRSLESAFRRWGYPLVFIAPNNWICLLAGSAGMSPALFLLLNVSGTVTRLVLIMVLGEAFETPINWVLGFISEYRIPLLIVSFTLVGFTVWNESRKGTSEIEQLRRLEHDLDGDHEDETGS
jgi:membrane protein DedA with SNARE-associated domain